VPSRGEAGPGGDDGFEGIYRASYARLVGQLYVVTTSRADAEEAVQEAFARLWARWDQVSGYEKIEAWVRRVAINAAIGRWRRTAREQPLHETSGEAVTADDRSGSDVEVLLALRTIPIHQRSALFLHHVVGLSVEEVADEMSSKPGTVKSWLSRGRTSLDALLSSTQDSTGSLRNQRSDSDGN
jgi:RNA polymerase sigma-70 factor (ECF subfamily)